jgi:transcriptional regulator with XRE-family HTH domain
MGRARKHPRPTASLRSVSAAADYQALLKRQGIADDGALRAAAELAGATVTQSTLNRLRNHALAKGPTAETMQAIAVAAGVPVEEAFPSLYTTGNSTRDRLRAVVAQLSAAACAEVLALAERLMEAATPPGAASSAANLPEPHLTHEQLLAIGEEERLVLAKEAEDDAHAAKPKKKGKQRKSSR